MLATSFNWPILIASSGLGAAGAVSVTAELVLLVEEAFPIVFLIGEAFVVSGTG